MDCIQKIKRMCRQIRDFTHIGRAIRKKTKRTVQYGIVILTEEKPLFQQIATKHALSAVSIDGVYSNYSSPDSDPPDFDPEEVKAHCGPEVQTAVGSLEELAVKGKETSFIHVVTYSKQQGTPDTRPQFIDYEDTGRPDGDSQHTKSQDPRALSISSSLYVNDSIINTNFSPVESEPRPEETKPGETKPGETKPGETKPGETKPEETKPGETKPGETKPGETKPGETKPGETKPGETKPGETKPGETKLEETKLEETRLEETKPSETKPGGQPDPQTPAEDYKQQPVHPMPPHDFNPKVMMQPIFHTPTWCGTWVVEARDEMTMQWTTACFHHKHDKDFKLPLAVGDLDEAKPDPKQQRDPEKWKGRVWHRINRLHYPQCVLHKVIERENWRATWVIEAKDLEWLKLEKLKLRGEGVDINLWIGIDQVV